MVARRRSGGNGGREELHVNVPCFFRCPISLDVMRSPVSLCTGVTYDRSSIQAWLDTGHNTCPATMQVLPTTDFVPNHTLHRLIQLWSSAQSLPHHHPPPTINPDALVRGLPSAADPLPSLRKLAEIAGDEARVRELVENGVCLPALHGVLLKKGLELEAMEAAVCVLSAVLRHRKEQIVQIEDRSVADLRILPSLVAVLRLGNLESRIATAWIVEAMASAGAEAVLQIAEAVGMLAELLRLVTDGEEGKPADPGAVDAGLAALAAVSSPRRVRPRIVALGAVPVLGKLLGRPSTPAAAAERAMRLMEAASTCTEGRAAICGDLAAVAAIVGRMTRAPVEAAERAVAVLWTVCNLMRDRRAQEAAAAAGALAKVLLVMQSNCSPAARQMGGDLLKILRANSKGDLPSYDSKTAHITPF